MFNCSIYVPLNWPKSELVSRLGTFLASVVRDFSVLENGQYVIDIDENEEYDEYECKKYPDGFLYFKYLLYLDFREGVTESYCYNEINKILEWFWSAGITAIASCDYEHLLVENGGYNSAKIPW